MSHNWEQYSYTTQFIIMIYNQGNNDHLTVDNNTVNNSYWKITDIFLNNYKMFRLSSNESVKIIVLSAISFFLTQCAGNFFTIIFFNQLTSSLHIFLHF